MTTGMACAKSTPTPSEGHWTGLRNFLRMFRGVHKRYLGQYVAFYQGMHNFKDAALQLLGTLLGPITSTGP